jgi:hypothetical protein
MIRVSPLLYSNTPPSLLPALPHRLENDLQATRRNLKEIENIRRDLAYRFKQAQATAEAGKKGSEERMERMERELEEGRKSLLVLQEKEVRREGGREEGIEWRVSSFGDCFPIFFSPSYLPSFHSSLLPSF